MATFVRYDLGLSPITSTPNGPLTAESLIRGFNEANYLARNPGVAEAVAVGSFESGLDHLLKFGMHESSRRGVPKRLTNLLAKSSAHPEPPEHLRVRVHGDDSAERFALVGKMVAYAMYSAISHLSLDDEPKQVLDFGCGCGRVLGHLSQLAPNNHYTGSDVDEEAIAWCAENLTDLAEFGANPDRPPSTYPGNHFDFVYSISVFTHLPEDMQFEWLAELARLTKPGGYALLTIHGEQLVGDTSKQRQVTKDGFMYAVGEGTDGLPGYYQTTYHSTDYIQDRWSQYFDVVTIVSQGLMGHQDLVVCRAR